MNTCIATCISVSTIRDWTSTSSESETRVPSVALPRPDSILTPVGGSPHRSILYETFQWPNHIDGCVRDDYAV